MALAACAATASHVLTGTARAAIAPDAVWVIEQAPERYEQIAELDARSGTSLRSTPQERFDEAVDALVREAARLGANAVLLEYDDVPKPSKIAVAVSAPTTTSDGVPLDVGFNSRDVHLSESVHGLAIYVSEWAANTPD